MTREDFTEDSIWDKAYNYSMTNKDGSPRTFIDNTAQWQRKNSFRDGYKQALDDIFGKAESTVHFFSTNKYITEDQYKKITNAKTTDDYVELANEGLVDMWIETPQLRFIEYVKPMSRKEKIKLLFKLVFSHD